MSSWPASECMGQAKILGGGGPAGRKVNVIEMMPGICLGCHRDAGHGRSSKRGSWRCRQCQMQVCLRDEGCFVPPIMDDGRVNYIQASWIVAETVGGDTAGGATASSLASATTTRHNPLWHSTLWTTGGVLLVLLSPVAVGLPTALKPLLAAGSSVIKKYE
jgi:hypothetical protein